MELTGRKVSWEIATVRVGDGSEKWSGGRDQVGKKFRGSEPDGHWYIEVAQLQYVVPSHEHEETLYFSCTIF